MGAQFRIRRTLLEIQIISCAKRNVSRNNSRINSDGVDRTTLASGKKSLSYTYSIIYIIHIFGIYEISRNVAKLEQNIIIYNIIREKVVYMGWLWWEGRRLVGLWSPNKPRVTVR